MYIKQLLSSTLNFFTRERLAFIGIVFLLVWFSTCNLAQKDRIIEGHGAQAEYWKDQYDNEHARLIWAEIGKEQLKEEVDSIAKVLKIKPKQVVSSISTRIKIDTSVTATSTPRTKRDTVWNNDTVERIDSSLVYDLNFTDSTFLSIKAIVPQSPQKVDVKLSADLSITSYWERKRILGLKIGAKKPMLDIGTNNPYIGFSNAKAYQLKLPPKIVIRPGVGVGITYNPSTGGLSPGIQAGIYLLRVR